MIVVCHSPITNGEVKEFRQNHYIFFIIFKEKRRLIKHNSCYNKAKETNKGHYASLCVLLKINTNKLQKLLEEKNNNNKNTSSKANCR